MALINRVSRLFRADLHAVLDRIEEPDALLRQAVREMEEALARDEQQLRLLRHEHRQIVARDGELIAHLERTAEELDVCFASDKDDLARALIRRRLETEALLKAVRRKRDALEQDLATLESRLEQNRRRLESMRQKAELLAEEENERAAQSGWSAPEVTVRDEDVEVAFLRERQRRAAS